MVKVVINVMCILTQRLGKKRGNTYSELLHYYSCGSTRLCTAIMSVVETLPEMLLVSPPNSMLPA